MFTLIRYLYLLRVSGRYVQVQLFPISLILNDVFSMFTLIRYLYLLRVSGRYVQVQILPFVLKLFMYIELLINFMLFPEKLPQSL